MADGRRHFSPVTGNGQGVGTSGMYESGPGRDDGIAPVKSHAADAAAVGETA